MAIDTDPVIGNWYQHVENGQKFEVVDIDEDRGVVEVQYIDGEVDELDMDEWYELELEASDEPDEDWEEEGDDATFAEAEPETWTRPKRGSKRQTDDYEDDDDDWEEDESDADLWDDNE